ncbi:MAG: pentapeptide repeat-containing protein [Myxococcota bacterium]|nr:pentapeptide repeat-containing protein [Myxococcota bacterium]
MSVSTRICLLSLLLAAGCLSGEKRYTGGIVSHEEDQEPITTACTERKEPCGVNSTCTITPDGRPHCECIDDFIRNVDGHCIAADPCDDLCGEGSTCIQGECTCFDGFELNSDLGCDDIDECETNNGTCDPNAVCQNRLGAPPQCICLPGFNATDDGRCEDIDECTTNNGGCGDVASWACTNTPGSFSCACTLGYVQVDGQCIPEACTLTSWTAKALEGCDYLSGADLAGANLSNADLTNADLSGADLTDADLSGAIVTGSSLASAQVDGLRAINLAGCPVALPAGWGCLSTPHAGIILAGPGANLSHVNLSEANMMEISLTDAHLEATNMTDADLTNVNLVGADLTDAIMVSAVMDGVSATYLGGCPSTHASNWTCIDIDSGVHALGPKANLSGTNLAGASLKMANLKQANLDGVNLYGADLSKSTLTKASFVGAGLAHVDFTDAVLMEADLTHANMSHAVLSGARGVHLVGCPDALPGAWNCQETVGSGYILAGPGADLSETDLTFAPLAGINLTDSDLYGADLGYADLTDTVLIGAQLHNSDLEYAVMHHADLTDIHLEGANLTGTDMTDAKMQGVRAMQLTGCPMQMPAAWECFYTPMAGKILAGPGANLAGIDLSDVDLSEMDLSGADMTGATMTGLRAIQLGGCPHTLPTKWNCTQTPFSGHVLIGPHVNLHDTNLKSSNLSGIDFTGADLSDAEMVDVRALYLEGCPTTMPEDWACISTMNSSHVFVGPGAALNHADLAGANLAQAKLLGVQFEGTNLSFANLSGANFTNTNLKHANLSYALLQNAVFSGAVIDGANFGYSNVTDTNWWAMGCVDNTTTVSNGGSCCGHLGNPGPALGCE